MPQMNPMYSVLNPRFRRQFTLDLDKLEKTYILAPFAHGNTTFIDMISTASDIYPGTEIDAFCPDDPARPMFIAWARRYHATRSLSAAAAVCFDGDVRFWHYDWQAGKYTGETNFEDWAPYLEHNDSAEALFPDTLDDFYSCHDAALELAALFRLTLDWGHETLQREDCRDEMRRVVRFLAECGHKNASTYDWLAAAQTAYEKERCHD